MDAWVQDLIAGMRAENVQNMQKCRSAHLQRIRLLGPDQQKLVDPKLLQEALNAQ